MLTSPKRQGCGAHLEAKLSSVMTPRKERKRLGLGFKPVKGYTTAPNSKGNTAPRGSSASSLAASRSRGNTFSVLIKELMAVLMAATCAWEPLAG
eukprot:1145381-Pelagomonas_calceolata.AAC.8